MNPDPKRPLKVFLCHAHPDAAQVRALYARLKADGVDAWLDKENIIPGQDWEMEIRKAVRESDIVVVCLSKQFSQKGYRQNEVRIALDEASLQPEGEIFIIPARLEECNYLESLKRFHGVDLFEERGYEYLMRALRLRADKIGAVLQSKKGWLGGLTSPTKKPDTQKPKPVVKPQPTPQTEEPKPVIVQKPLRKWNTKMTVAIAGVVVIFAAIFGLLRNQWFVTIPGVATLTPTPIPQLAEVTALTYFYDNATGSEHSQFLTAMKTHYYVCRQEGSRVLLAEDFCHLVKPKGWIETEVIRFISASTPTNTVAFSSPQPTLTKVFSTSTFTPVSPTKTKSPTLAPTLISLSEEIIDDKGVKMRLVPAGEFTMGSEIGAEDEKPVHKVFLDTYYIDKYEVTNFLYKACVTSGICALPARANTITNPIYYDNPQFDNYPVVSVDWNMAKTYCEWRGARLPTEAEWEKAARGTDSRIYPWEEITINCNKANYESCIGDTTEVGAYGKGKSPYGAYDMAGNVWEWVADWFSESYYLQSPSSNPLGSAYGETRVLRGGFWGSSMDDTRSSNRADASATAAQPVYGIRCAYTP